MEDGDGIWSPDIEEAFEEALALYPPCGRRKIILSEEGKMYGRNELIARYIKARTGKSRSRKQVSSHIQVLARKKQRDLQTHVKSHPELDHLKYAFNGMSSAEIVSPASQGGSGAPADRASSKSFSGTPYKDHLGMHYPHSPGGVGSPIQRNLFAGSASDIEAPINVALDHFVVFAEGHNSTATFVEYRGSRQFFEDPEPIDIMAIEAKFPMLLSLYQRGPQAVFFAIKFWVSLAHDWNALASAAFGVGMRFDSTIRNALQATLTVNSIGKQVLEQNQTCFPSEDPSNENVCIADYGRNPLCSHMVGLIRKLGGADPRQVAQVLDNLTVLMVVRDDITNEIQFCAAILFDVSPTADNSCNVYQLCNFDEDHTRRFTY